MSKTNPPQRPELPFVLNYVPVNPKMGMSIFIKKPALSVVQNS